jgi:hypothetical protein
MTEEKTFDGANEEHEGEAMGDVVAHEEKDEAVESSDCELVLEDSGKEYKPTKTGINIKYVLSESEVAEIFKYTEGYRKNRQLQRRHTTIQSILFVILIILWLFLKNSYYGFLAIMPLVCIAVIWIVPLFSLKRLAREFFSGEEINAEIYPDKVKIKVKEQTREIALNPSVKYEELGGMILLYPAGESTVMIPIRAIDSKDLPDVQAMIFAGASPKSKSE